MIAFAPGRPDRRLDDLYTFAGEDRVEHAGELPVPVADQKFELCNKATEVHEQIACLLATQSAVGCAVTPKRLLFLIHV
jgi:hypothetical protein